MLSCLVFSFCLIFHGSVSGFHRPLGPQKPFGTIDSSIRGKKMSAAQKTAVFVYGTLKRGHYNHKFLTASNSICLGRYTTSQTFPMVVDEYYVPYLLPAIGSGRRVTGEVYLVDSETFAALDGLEGFPDYYDRVQVDVHPVAEEAGAGGVVAEEGAAAAAATTATVETDRAAELVRAAGAPDGRPWAYMMPTGKVTADILEREMLAEYLLAEHLEKYVPKEQRDAGHASHTTANTSLVEAHGTSS